MRQLTHGSLFSGIGGFDLGLEWAGIKTVWQVERDWFCREVLKARFDAELHEDIIEVGQHNLRSVDIISGGFPCQDISVAGQRAGLEGQRSGLWWQMHRVIGEMRPTWALIENVSGLKTKGADEVLSAMEELGYTCWPTVVPAYAVGTPHNRERVWIVCYAEHHGPSSGAITRSDAQELRGNTQGQNSAMQSSRASASGDVSGRVVAHSDVAGLEESDGRQPEAGAGSIVQPSRSDSIGGDGNMADSDGARSAVRLPAAGHWQEGVTEVANNDSDRYRKWPNGLGREQFRWEADRLTPRAPRAKRGLGRATHGLSARVDRLKSLGNSVVPQIVQVFGEFIVMIEETNGRG